MVTLGGEHSISVGAVRALKERHPDLSVLMLDAHADFRDSYQGSPYSHATVGRRIAESCPLALVGVRSLSSEEREAIEETGQPMYPWPQDRSIAQLADAVLSNLTETVYISVDLDALGPLHHVGGRHARARRHALVRNARAAAGSGKPSPHRGLRPDGACPARGARKLRLHRGQTRLQAHGVCYA